MEGQIQAEQHMHAKMTDVIQRLKKLDSRLSRVTTSVCGSCPESGSENPKPIDENLLDKLNVTYRVLNSLEDEMTRLENVVGVHQSQAGMKSASASGY